MAKKTKGNLPTHHWASLFIRMELPGESQLVEWCTQCGKLKLERWEAKGRARKAERPHYYVPNADYPRDMASSHNTWSLREPPRCRAVPPHAR